MANSRRANVDKTIEQLNGSPTYLGTISVTTSNTSSSLSSAIQKGDRLLLQPDAACVILPATSGSPSPALTATTGIKLSADEKFYICLKDDAAPFNQNGERFIQAITASGTANLKVFRLD